MRPSEEEISRWHEADLKIECPKKDCKAGIGEECKDLPRGLVHFTRRVYRLFKFKTN